MDIEDTTAYEFITTKLYNTLREKFIPTRVYDKATSYIETVNALIDRDTRASTVFQVGVNALIWIGSKALGSSIEKHPYFALHKLHLQALCDALNAQSLHDNAIALMDQAARAADGTDAISANARMLLQKMRDLRVEFGFKGGFEPDSDSVIAIRVPAMLTQVGLVLSAMGAGATVMSWQVATWDWQARVCRVYLDGLKLLSMARVEWQVAKRGGELFQEKLTTMLRSTKQISQVAGYATMQDQQWAQFDRMDAQSRGKKTGSPAAIGDPGRYAGGAVRDVEAIVRKLAAMCDIAMSGLPAMEKANRMAVSL